MLLLFRSLHHVRWRKGRPLAQDIISIASALFPRSEMGDDPFWAGAASNYIASYIAYVFDALYSGYTGEYQLMSSLYRNGLDTLRPPADMGVDVVSLNLKQQLENPRAAPETFFFSGQASTQLWSLVRFGCERERRKG